MGLLAPTSRTLPFLLVAALCLVGSRAGADPPPAKSPAAPATAPAPAPPKKVTQADRDAARTFAEQGFERFQQRKYSEAIALFSRAEERFHAPTHVAFIARSHEKRGELLEAADDYRKLLAETLPKDAPQPFRDAQAEAAPALEAILRRIPRLRVDVAGAGAAQAQITASDRPLVAGVATASNPGTVVVRVTAPDLSPVERTVVLPETTDEVTVRFDLARPMSIAWPVTALALGLGAGGAALATGFASQNMKASALHICQDDIVCSDEGFAARQEQLASAQQLENVAIGVGIAGGVLLAGAVTLFVLRPTSKSAVDPASATSSSATLPRPTFAVRAGPSFVGISGSF